MITISDIVSESLKLAFKHKILWVFALLLVAGSGSYRFNDVGDLLDNDRSVEKSEINVKQNNFYRETGKSIITAPAEEISLENSTNKLSSAVLGSATKKYEDGFTFIRDIQHKSFPYIVGAGTIVFVSLIVFLLIRLYVQSWAQGAFLRGLKYSIEDFPLNLRKLAGDGRFTVKRFVKYKLSVFFVYLILALLIIGPFILSISSKFVGLSIVLGIVAFILLLVLGCTIAISTNYAYRYISYKDTDSLEGFKAGFTLFRNNMGNSLLLGVVNAFIGAGISIAVGVSVIIVGLILARIFVFTSKTLGDALYVAYIPFAAILLPLGIAAGLLAMSLRAYIYTYSQFTWTKLFFKVYKEDTHGNA